MDHFKSPRNVGEIPDADGIGEVGNPICGDVMFFYIKVANDRLKDVKFKTFGCGAAIAVSSIISEMAIGKTLDEAMKISRNDVAKELGGLPPKKMHCSNLGADALHKAIEDYRTKQQKKTAEMTPKTKEARPQTTGKAVCPYCEKETISQQLPYCQPCEKEFVTCPKCKQLVLATTRFCTNCQTKI